MDKYIKNIEPEETLRLADQVEYMHGQIVSKTLVQNSAVSMTIFAFDKDEQISSHESSGDALISVLDGTGEITIAGNKYLLNSGDSILMPANKPHAVYSAERFKMLLTVVFPSKSL